MFLTKGMQEIERMREDNKKKCLSEFKDICNLTETAIDLMRRLTPIISSVDKETALNNPQLQTNHVLFSRAIDTAISAYDITLKGEYGVAKGLVRLIFEISFLMKYFSNNSSEAKQWIENKKTFSQREIRELIFDGKAREDFTKFYSVLCDYIHPNVKGCLEYFKATPSEGHADLLIKNMPLYDSRYAKDSLHVLLYSIYFAIGSILITFKNQIEARPDMVEKLHETETEILKFLPIAPE